MKHIKSHKTKFPYHYQYYKLGGHHTIEGINYGYKHSHEMMREYSKHLDLQMYRAEMGGNDGIHKIIFFE